MDWKGGGLLFECGLRKDAIGRVGVDRTWAHAIFDGILAGKRENNVFWGARARYVWTVQYKRGTKKRGYLVTAPG